MARLSINKIEQKVKSSKEKDDLSDWNSHKILHRSKIVNFDYLLKNELIKPIENSNFFYAVDDLEEKYYKLKYEQYIKENKNISIESEINTFINKLNKYNELKDCAEALIGKIAEIRGCSIKEIREEMGVPE
ncbi:putative DNA repair protein, Swi5 protein [Pseudoloma neurophilia]|uniref:Putative DNA repair protein, Swi5 protein n=1 Tax=Pseudoloma neurophilia TaxID=146866 RepID=A0A0R0LQK9_9MICR|nr:putative DNA repair protein, Swi5 protein [Pseudoloma neurophilia]